MITETQELILERMHAAYEQIKKSEAHLQRAPSCCCAADFITAANLAGCIWLLTYWAQNCLEWMGFWRASVSPEHLRFPGYESWFEKNSARCLKVSYAFWLSLCRLKFWVRRNCLLLLLKAFLEVSFTSTAASSHLSKPFYLLISLTLTIVLFI